MAGAGVDLVGDAHELTRYFEPATFDAIYGVAVFEHLLMPWRVVTEMNRVLRPGGIVRLTSHECFPLHEQPWDFWRFQPAAWRALFDSRSGFEVVEQQSVSPAELRPWHRTAPTRRVHQHTIVHLRKVAEVQPDRIWDVLPRQVLPSEHFYAASSRRSAFARILDAVRWRVQRVVRLPASRPDPLRLAALGRWHLVVGPDAHEVRLPSEWTRHFPAHSMSGAVREALAELAPASVRRLALLDVLPHDVAPWTLAPAIHRVLEPGGLVFVGARHADGDARRVFSLSAEALLGLFHRFNGFQVERRAMLDPASLHADRPEERCSPLAVVLLRTVGLIRKVGPCDESRMNWK